MFLAVTEGVLVSLILVSVRHVWGYLFTNEEEVVSYMSKVMPVLALSNFMDGIQGVLSGKSFNFLIPYVLNDCKPVPLR